MLSSMCLHAILNTYSLFDRCESAWKSLSMSVWSAVEVAAADFSAPMRLAQTVLNTPLTNISTPQQFIVSISEAVIYTRYYISRILRLPGRFRPPFYTNAGQPSSKIPPLQVQPTVTPQQAGASRETSIKIIPPPPKSGSRNGKTPRQVAFSVGCSISTYTTVRQKV